MTSRRLGHHDTGIGLSVTMFWSVWHCLQKYNTASFCFCGGFAAAVLSTGICFLPHPGLSTRVRCHPVIEKDSGKSVWKKQTQIRLEWLEGDLKLAHSILHLSTKILQRLQIVVRLSQKQRTVAAWQEWTQWTARCAWSRHWWFQLPSQPKIFLTMLSRLLLNFQQQSAELWHDSTNSKILIYLVPANILGIAGSRSIKP